MLASAWLITLACPAQENAVEPAVQTAFSSAWERLPRALREVVDGIGLARAECLDVPGEAPLEYRLAGRAAHAVYDILRHRIVVFDAGVSGTPRWSEPAPEPMALAAFLSRMADLLGVPAPVTEETLGAAWQAFVARAQAWPEWRAEPDDPSTVPLGDPRWLEQFLAAAVERSLEGRPPLEDLLLHELAHAVQLAPRDESERMRAWGTVSGWVETAEGEAADGYVAGAHRIETPMVLLRLLFGDDRAAGDFAPAPAARFATCYARSDLREDYAETVRLLATRPAELAARAPTKFLVANTIGRGASADRRAARTLWIDAARTLEWQRQLRPGIEHLLGRGDGPAIDPELAAAVLRAHRPLVEALASELGALPQPAALPGDLPAGLGGAQAIERFVFEVGGRRAMVDPGAAERWIVTALEQSFELIDYELGFEALWARDRVELRRYVVDELEPTLDPWRRWQVFRFAWADAQRVFSSAERAALASREARFLEAAGRPRLAEAVRVEAGMPSSADPGGSPVDADAVELGAARARRRLRDSRPVRPVEVLAEIPGPAYGACARVRLAVQMAQERPDTAEVWWIAARTSADEVGWAPLHASLRGLVEDALKLAPPGGDRR